MNPDIHTYLWTVGTCDEMLQLATLTSTVMGMAVNDEQRQTLSFVSFVRVFCHSNRERSKNQNK